jgi:hypothetical protein
MKQLRFRFAGWMLAFLALGLGACGGGGGDSGSGASLINSTPSTQAAVHELVDVFAATLTAAQAEPPHPSAASGSGTVSINPDTRQMTVVLTTTGLAGTGANIHQAPSGVNGPVIFPLVETPPGSGVWTTTATVSEAQYNAFRLGEFYFNVQSLAFAGGEIRGQIISHVPGSVTPATAAASAGASPFVTPVITSSGTFLSALRGTQEVPPNTSTAFGAGTVMIDPVSRQMTAVVSTTGIAGTAAHIHQAAPGINGPIIIPLTQATPGGSVWLARAVLTEDQYTQLRNGNLYFNVHSAALPAGEIRGQILPQQLPLSGITGVEGPLSNITPPATGAGATGAGAPALGTGTATPGTGTTGTGTAGTGVPGTGTTTPGTGITGTGATGTGITGTGITGTGIGIPGFGIIGTGLTGTGTGSAATGNTAGFRF